MQHQRLVVPVVPADILEVIGEFLAFRKQFSDLAESTTPSRLGSQARVTREGSQALADGAGDYSLGMPAGSYVLFAEAFEFDPAATLIPDPVEVTITAGQNLTIDFDWLAAAGAAHQVLTVQGFESGVSVEAELAFRKESATTPGDFFEFAETNTLFDGQDHEAILALTPGTYEIEVQFANGQTPSLPSLTEITVTASEITFEGSPLVGGFLEIDLDPPINPNGFLVSGVVRDAAGAVVSGVQVEANDLLTGSPGASATTDLGGNYDLDLFAGSYEVQVVGPFPSGNIAAASVEVVVTDNAGTLSATFDGAPTANGVLDFDLLAAHGQLDGTIFVDGVATDGSILIFDGLTQIAEEFTSAGAFSILLPAGTFDAIALVPSLDHINILTPLPLTLTVADTGSVEVTNHDFDFIPLAANPGATLFGRSLVDGLGQPSDLIVTLSSGEMVAKLFADSDGAFAVTLPPEDFLIAIGNNSLPQNFSNEISTEFSIVGNTIAGPGVVEQNLTFAVNTAGSTVSGNVTDHLGGAVADAVLYFEWEDSLYGTQNAWALTDISGDYSILLGDQFYEAWFPLSSIPSGSVRPALADVDVQQAPLTLDFVMLEAVGTIAGSSLLDGASSSEADIFVLDPNTLTEVTWIEVDSNGDYLIDMPAGTFTLVAEADIDYDKLLIRRPEVIFDLPAGGRRLIQEAQGYLATVQSGAVTFENGEHSGALPGGVIRGQQAGPRPA